MKITLVTPTCDRPEAFALCEKWMAKQTVKHHQWIVLDDGLTPAPCTMGQTLMRFEDTRGKASLANKINRLMKQRDVITGECFAIIEDDDWYRCNYLERAIERIQNGEDPYDMIGEGRALYYNVRTSRWDIHGNMTHASLCQTVFRTTMCDALQKTTENLSPFIDAYVWKDAPRNLKRKVFEPGERPTLVGVKGIYGGYGVGHTAKLKHIDADRSKLRDLMGTSDAAVYDKYAGTAS